MDIKREFISDWSREKIAEGRVEGLAQGLAQGAADAILRVLAVRHIAVSEAAAARIHACKDVAVLDAWLERAVTVENVEAMFD